MNFRKISRQLASWLKVSLLIVATSNLNNPNHRINGIQFFKEGCYFSPPSTTRLRFMYVYQKVSTLIRFGYAASP